MSKGPDKKFRSEVVSNPRPPDVKRQQLIFCLVQPRKNEIMKNMALRDDKTPLDAQFLAFWDSTEGFFEAPTLDQGQLQNFNINFDISKSVNQVSDMYIDLHRFFMKISKMITVLCYKKSFLKFLKNGTGSGLELKIGCVIPF